MHPSSTLPPPFTVKKLILSKRGEQKGDKGRIFSIPLLHEALQHNPKGFFFFFLISERLILVTKRNCDSPYCDQKSSQASKPI
jgi:hypothetical protein